MVWTDQDAHNFIKKIVLTKSQNPVFELCICGHTKAVHDIDGGHGGKGCMAIIKDGVCECNYYRKK